MLPAALPVQAADDGHAAPAKAVKSAAMTPPAKAIPPGRGRPAGQAARPAGRKARRPSRARGRQQHRACRREAGGRCSPVVCQVRHRRCRRQEAWRPRQRALGLRRRSRPGRLGRPEARIQPVRQGPAPEPDRHPRRHRGRPGAGAVRLQAPAASASSTTATRCRSTWRRATSSTSVGRRCELLQFHFHRPSEERIDGRQFDMVAHLVHKDADGKLAVVAVLLDTRQHPAHRADGLEQPAAGEGRGVQAAVGDRPQPPAAAGPPLLHLHGLADDAAVQRRRAVDGDAPAGAGVAASRSTSSRACTR